MGGDAAMSRWYHVEAAIEDVPLQEDAREETGNTGCVCEEDTPVAHAIGALLPDDLEHLQRSSTQGHRTDARTCGR